MIKQKEECFMFLPICREDLIERQIEQLDFVYVSGDAYVDHPTFGSALICRLVESYGFSIGIIAQPVSNADYMKLGEPKHSFLVGSGVVDSMVNNYTASKRKRSTDDYSEGGIAGKRPDRALAVYCKKIKKIFPSSAVIIGGIEGSLRRFAHYDYWSDEVMPSILEDTGADLLMYGMGENPIKDLTSAISRGIPVKKIRHIRGTSFLVDKEHLPLKDAIFLPSFEDVKKDKKQYCKAFNIQNQNTDGRNANVLIQKQNNGMFVVQNLPALPLSEKMMDYNHTLPFERRPHPIYAKGVPAIEEVEFSITSSRGCFGGCSFCAINYHQGRAVQTRSKQSIIDEAKKLTENKNFKGYIHDIGGPSANFFKPSCRFQEKNGICKHKQCIGANPCPNLEVDHSGYVDVLKEVRALPKVKKVFIRSGIRFDYLMMDKNSRFFDELVKNHISGQLKIAPEHISNSVLSFMNKPSSNVYFQFAKRFEEKNKKLKMNQFLVPYFISSHPACTLKDAIVLAEYLNSIGYMPKQVQDFYPTPSTKSTCAFYTGLDPDTLKPIFVPKTPKEKQMQRALLQWRKNENYDLVKEALVMAGRTDLIGYDKKCLIKPVNYAQKYSKENRNKQQKKQLKTSKEKINLSSQNRKK